MFDPLIMYYLFVYPRQRFGYVGARLLEHQALRLFQGALLLFFYRDV